MPANVEIKAIVRNIIHLTKTAKELSNDVGKQLFQEDTYFEVSNGRLKFREIKDRYSELIYYDRIDAEGPKQSLYKKQIIQSNEVDGLKEVLKASLGIRGIVKKTRTLYMVEQTRIHVDDVEGLGHFMELEVMMQPNQSVDEGRTIADDLMNKLGITTADLLAGSYIDMLLAKRA